MTKVDTTIFKGNLTAEAGKGYEYTEITGDLVANVPDFGKAFPNLGKIGGYLDLGSLTDAKGLTLPQSIGGGLYLGSLTDAPKIKTNDSEARTIARGREMHLCPLQFDI